ncbi:MAG: MarR family transcriptional regulator [Candidatus Dormibacteraeota bacterium]|nr:MarR family transcriptional regulator [Candidatus Dormibacteraeota bacterium]
MIVTRGTLTGILDSLERRGMIRRLPHSGDGRMTLVEIVPEAATRIQQLRKHLHRMERRLMSCLTQEQKRTFLAALGRMQESIEQLDL